MPSTHRVPRRQLPSISFGIFQTCGSSGISNTLKPEFCEPYNRKSEGGSRGEREWRGGEKRGERKEWEGKGEEGRDVDTYDS